MGRSRRTRIRDDDWRSALFAMRPRTFSYASAHFQQRAVNPQQQPAGPSSRRSWFRGDGRLGVRGMRNPVGWRRIRRVGVGLGHGVGGGSRWCGLVNNGQERFRSLCVMQWTSGRRPAPIESPTLEQHPCACLRGRRVRSLPHSAREAGAQERNAVNGAKPDPISAEGYITPPEAIAKAVTAPREANARFTAPNPGAAISCAPSATGCPASISWARRTTTWVPADRPGREPRAQHDDAQRQRVSS